MAKEIIWSLRAQNDRKEILKYWINRNKSSGYSRKLNRLFKEAVNLIAEHPEIGKPTDDKDARIKVLRNYLIIYEIKNERISILTIWDNRQDPARLKKVLKK